MKLKHLLKEIDYEVMQADMSLEIKHIAYDSRQVLPQSLFVCISGSCVDGHKFIDDVIAKGATVIVVEKDVKMQDNITYIRVNNARRALALLSCAFFSHPSRQMTVIGMTGTKGKTTTSYMMESILRKAGKNVGIIGTIGAIINGEFQKTKNTTPESYELQRLMRQMVDSGCAYCVMEVSSQGLMLERVTGIDFDYGVFTNLSPDHISDNEHKSFEHYKECKKKLFHMCKTGVFNQDDEHYSDMIEHVPCDVKTYSIKKDSDLQAKQIQLSQGAHTFGVEFQTQGLVDDNFECNIPGAFSVYNSLVAILICHLLGIETCHIQTALTQVSVPGRVEILPLKQDYIVIIDYAHNVLSVDTILETIKAYQPRRMYCVYGAGGHRDKERRYAVGEVVANHHAISILTADNPRGEDVTEICQDIVTGIERVGGEYIIIEDRKDAIHYALKHAQSGDVILCLGKGHEDYQITKKGKLPFSEKSIIEDYFQSKAL